MNTDTNLEMSNQINKPTWTNDYFSSIALLILTKLGWPGFMWSFFSTWDWYGSTGSGIFSILSLGEYSNGSTESGLESPSEKHNLVFTNSYYTQCTLKSEIAPAKDTIIFILTFMKCATLNRRVLVTKRIRGLSRHRETCPGHRDYWVASVGVVIEKKIFQKNLQNPFKNGTHVLLFQKSRVLPGNTRVGKPRPDLRNPGSGSCQTRVFGCDACNQ